MSPPVLAAIITALDNSPHGGSLPGKAPNRNRRFSQGHQNLVDDYLGPDALYVDENHRRRDKFRLRFRMPRDLFLRICNDVSKADRYLGQLKDATGKPGPSAEQKVTSALRMLAYGIAADAVDEYCRVGESTALQCMKRFCAAIVNVYEARYLRAPSADDVANILHTNALRGFPGMLGSIDCMHWFWEKCPRAWAGQATGKDGKPSIVLEAVATQDLRIWHCFFGSVGSCNDLNILDRSPLLQDLYNGKSMEVSYTLNGKERTTPYYLADGIYPDWTVFVKSLTAPVSEKQSHFAKEQEACRKDVERAFGVLQARWHILARPCKLWFAKDMAVIIRACIIMHNMIIEYDATNGAFQETLDPPDDATPFVHCDFETFTTNMARVRDTKGHCSLRNDIIEHLWQHKGNK
jgi:hypothetical protein